MGSGTEAEIIVRDRWICLAVTSLVVFVGASVEPGFASGGSRAGLTGTDEAPSRSDRSLLREVRVVTNGSLVPLPLSGATASGSRLAVARANGTPDGRGLLVFEWVSEDLPMLEQALGGRVEPFRLVISPGAHRLNVANRLARDVSVFVIDAVSGSLSLLQIMPVAGSTEPLALPPDGRRVAVATIAEDGTQGSPEGSSVGDLPDLATIVSLARAGLDP